MFPNSLDFKWHSKSKQKDSHFETNHLEMDQNGGHFEFYYSKTESKKHLDFECWVFEPPLYFITHHSSLNMPNKYRYDPQCSNNSNNKHPESGLI